MQRRCAYVETVATLDSSTRAPTTQHAFSRRVDRALPASGHAIAGSLTRNEQPMARRRSSGHAHILDLRTELHGCGVTFTPSRKVGSLMTASEQLQHLLSARQTLGGDFFGGWTPADLDLFARHHKPAAGSAGYVTDYFGVKTRTDFVPWANALNGHTLTTPPIPNDGVRAEAIEYVALLDSIEHSAGPHFAMVELGASYAPWAALAGVIAKRLGKNVSVRAVEASSYFHALIPENYTANGLVGDSNGVGPTVESVAIHGAVGIKKGTMFFPVVNSAFENGGQAADSVPDVDYVGRAVPHEEVPIRTLDEIFDGLDAVDFLHCDIQGSEEDVLVHGAALLSQKVKRMFVGTHSRKIEGALIECLHKHGWHLMRERPVTFAHQPQLSSVVGMTTIDGGQYWVNSRF